MKKVCKLFLLLALFVLAACSTGNIRNGKVPYWYYRPQESANNFEIAFVGEGAADTDRQALLFAYSDLNNKISDYLGSETDEEMYRELSRTGMVKAFDLKISQKHQVVSNGQYYVYVLATADKKLITNAKSQTKLEEDEIIKSAKALIHEGDEYIKSNQDILGLKKYLQSMVLTYSLTQIEPEFSFAAILDEVEYILGTTEIQISNQDMYSANCKVRVKRKETVISSNVENCPVIAYYKARDSRNRLYEDSFVFTTGHDGSVHFSPKNHLIEKIGKVVFNIDITAELNQIERLSKSAADRIKSLLEKTACTFDYMLEYHETKYGFCILELDDSGNYKNSDTLNTMLKKHFDSDSVLSVGFAVDKTDFKDEELIRKVKTNSNRIQYMIIGRAMASDFVQSKNNLCGTTTEGNVKIYNVETGELIFDSGIIYSNGFAQIKEDSKNQSFKNFSSLIYSLIKVYYV